MHSIQEWVVSEGIFRMLEHIILLIVAVRFIKGLLSIESRGNIGVVSYLTKVALRVADKISFVKDKKEKYL